MNAMHHRTQRVLLLGAFTAAGVAGAITYDQAAAHAADKPPAVEQPGGLLDTVTEPVEDVVDEVQPAPEPDEPEPSEEPADEPEAETPDKPQPDKATEPAPAPPAPIGDVVDDVEDGLDDIGEVITDPPLPVPAPTEPLPLPVLTPAPTEPTEPVTVTLPDLTPGPVRVDPPAIIQPPPAAPLPVVIGPLPAIGVHLDGTPVRTAPGPVAAATAAEVPLCYDQPPPDVVRQLIDSLTGGTTATAKPGEPAKACPGTPATPDGPAINQLTVKPPNGNAADLVNGDTATAITWPTLQQLERLRPRSHIPAGRNLSVEPGPA